MNLRDLKRIPPPKRVEAKLCACCKAFRAECEAPVGEGSAPMCWLCAHHVVEHDTPVCEASTARCECLPHEIYPDRVLRFEHGDITREMIENATPEELLNGHLFNPNTKSIDTIVRGEVVVRLSLVDEARAKVEALTPAERKLLRDSTKNPKRCN